MHPLTKKENAIFYKLEWRASDKCVSLPHYFDLFLLNGNVWQDKHNELPSRAAHLPDLVFLQCPLGEPHLVFMWLLRETGAFDIFFSGKLSELKHGINFPKWTWHRQPKGSWREVLCHRSRSAIHKATFRDCDWWLSGNNSTVRYGFIYDVRLGEIVNVN